MKNTGTLNITTPTDRAIVMTRVFDAPRRLGSKSEAFFHAGAKALTNILPDARYRVLEGRDHSAVLMASGAVADEVAKFFLSHN